MAKSLDYYKSDALPSRALATRLFTMEEPSICGMFLLQKS